MDEPEGADADLVIENHHCYVVLVRVVMLWMNLPCLNSRVFTLRFTEAYYTCLLHTEPLCCESRRCSRSISSVVSVCVVSKMMAQ